MNAVLLNCTALHQQVFLLFSLQLQHLTVQQNTAQQHHKLHPKMITQLNQHLTETFTTKPEHDRLHEGGFTAGLLY